MLVHCHNLPNFILKKKFKSGTTLLIHLPVKKSHRVKVNFKQKRKFMSKGEEVYYYFFFLYLLIFYVNFQCFHSYYYYYYYKSHHHHNQRIAEINKFQKI
jgi:hypothetical protein